MTRIHPSAIVESGATIGDGAEIGPYCVIGPHVTIGPGARLMSHVVVDGWTTIGGGGTIFPFASLGTQTQDLKYKGGRTFVEIGDRTTIREYVTVNSGTAEGEVTRVGSDCHIMAYCHVAHGCRVGNRIIMANTVSLAGEVVVEDDAVLGGLTGVHQFCRIGRLCMIGAGTIVRQDCAPYTLVSGNPPTVPGLNVVGLRRHGIAGESLERLKQAFRLVYQANLTLAQAIEQIEQEAAACPEVGQFVAFLKGVAARGITR